jgi:hypothetical protein
MRYPEPYRSSPGFPAEKYPPTLGPAKTPSVPIARRPNVSRPAIKPVFNFIMFLSGFRPKRPRSVETSALCVIGAWGYMYIRGRGIVSYDRVGGRTTRKAHQRNRRNQKTQAKASISTKSNVANVLICLGTAWQLFQVLPHAREPDGLFCGWNTSATFSAREVSSLANFHLISFPILRVRIRIGVHDTRYKRSFPMTP